MVQRNDPIEGAGAAFDDLETHIRSRGFLARARKEFYADDCEDVLESAHSAIGRW